MHTIESCVAVALSNLEAGNVDQALYAVDKAIRLREQAKKREAGAASVTVENLARFLLEKYGSTQAAVQWVDRNVDSSWTDWATYQDARVYLERLGDRITEGVC